MEKLNEVYRLTVNELFDVIICTSSYSEHIAGLRTKRLENGWKFILRSYRDLPVVTGRKAKKRSKAEGSIEIRATSEDPPQTQVISTPITKEAQQFFVEIQTLLAKRPEVKVSRYEKQPHTGMGSGANNYL
jgi:hypothetical protein